MLNNKKILFLVKTMDLGGAERFTIDLAEGLLNDFESVTIASSGGIFETLLKEKNISHILLNEKLKIANILGIAKELNSIISAGKYDIIHTQHRILQFALQLIPGRSFRTVYTSHNYFTDLYQKMIFADKAVAVSKSIETNLKKTSLLKDDRISFIHCGTQIMKDKNVVLSSPVIFGFTGRLIKEKGIFVLLDAALKLKECNLPFRIVYRGEGDNELLQQEISSREIYNEINLLPCTVNKEEIYKNLDVLVLPSLFNEGLPLSILEAASRKKLILTGKAGGTGDFVKHDKSGIVLNQITSEELFNEMKRIILGEIDFVRLTENAYKLLKEEYSIENTHLRYKELYESLF